ncbi:MAG: Wzz/FepE/Etk N-terminal domain-containing protein [Bacteroidales bacterium]|nr:Wzz/FepE/Etk N-terminal domain-containing protein [Bacteroidales bacterium]
MENNDKYNAFSLLKFIWDRKKWFLAVCIATFVVSAACSLLVRPRFRSTAVIYAPRTSSVAKILLNEQNYNERLDIRALATVDETEQMMAYLNSVTLKDSLIAKYKLAEYYDIDMSNKGAQTKLYKTLDNNIVIKRTDLGSISVTIADWDAQKAYDMTVDAVRWLDTIKNAIDRERLEAAYKDLQRQLDSINKAIAINSDSICELMKHGVFNVERQSERYTQQYAAAVAQGNTAAMNRLRSEMDTLAKYGSKLTALLENEFNFSQYQALTKQKMLDAQLDLNTTVPVKFVIDKPFKADKKFYPKRSIIVVVSVLCAFLLTLVVLLIADKIDEKTSESSTESEKR